MEKKSKVTLANYSRSFTTDNGIFFVHAISLENGDTGEYSSKSQDQTKFVVGTEVDYTIDASNPAYAAKIKPVSTYVQSGGSNGQAAEPGRQASIEKQVALKIASESVDLAHGGTDAVLAVADKYFDWLQGTQAPPQQPTTIDTAQAVNKDKLPF